MADHLVGGPPNKRQKMTESFQGTSDSSGEDFDLYVLCYEKDGHPHKMDFDDGSSLSDQKQANPQEARKLSIQRCIHSLVYACQCRDGNCRLPNCQKMKRVGQHTNICKQLIALCCYHAKHSQETKCPVPFSRNIKHKLKQQQLQQRLQQAQLRRRRMAVMNTCTTVPTGAHQANSMAGALVSGSVSPASVVGGPGTAGGMVMGLPHQPGIGLKPGMQIPPANVLQVVKQVQEEAARQQAPHAQVGYGKVTPPGVVGDQPQVMLPLLMQRISPSAGPHLIPMEQWTPRYPSNPALQQNSGLRQHSPQLLQQQQQVVQVPPQQQPQPLGSLGPTHIGPGSSPNLRQVAVGGMAAGAGVAGGAGLQKQALQQQVLQQQALQQLLHILKSPNTPEQQQQILQIVNTNPRLMAAFIKQRQVYQHQQRKPRTRPVGVQEDLSQALQQLIHILKCTNTQEQQQQQILQIFKSNPQLMTAFINQHQVFQHQQRKPRTRPVGV